MTKIISLLLKVGTLLRKPLFWIVLYALGTTYWIASQQAEIDTLKEQLETEHTMERSDTFHYRLSNLENISNSHGDRLKELERDSWQLKRFANQHQFRIMQLEWEHPNIESPEPSKATPVKTPFKANPTNVPDVKQ